MQMLETMDTPGGWNKSHTILEVYKILFPQKKLDYLYKSNFKGMGGVIEGEIPGWVLFESPMMCPN